MGAGEHGRATDYWVDYFERQVQKDFGVDVSVRSKAKQILKFGRSSAAGTAISTVQFGGGNETYLTGNTITKLAVSVASTTDIVVEGHTIDGNGDFTFVVQTITLNGAADVALTTPLARCSRLANVGSTVLTGNVRAETAANVVYCQIPAGQQQSYKASTTISKDDYYGIKQVAVGVSQKTAGTAEFQIEIRRKGGVFRPLDLIVAASPGSTVIERYEPYVVVPANADVRVRCIADGNSTPVAASFEGVLAIDTEAIQ